MSSALVQDGGKNNDQQELSKPEEQKLTDAERQAVYQDEPSRRRSKHRHREKGTSRERGGGEGDIERAREYGRNKKKRRHRERKRYKEDSEDYRERRRRKGRSGEDRSGYRSRHRERGGSVCRDRKQDRKEAEDDARDKTDKGMVFEGDANLGTKFNTRKDEDIDKARDRETDIRKEEENCGIEREGNRPTEGANDKHGERNRIRNEERTRKSHKGRYRSKERGRHRDRDRDREKGRHRRRHKRHGDPDRCKKSAKKKKQKRKRKGNDTQHGVCIPRARDLTLDLSTLTKEEEKVLKKVIKKDEAEMRAIDQRVSILRTEIEELRQRGLETASNKSGKGDNPKCARCAKQLRSWKSIIPFGDKGVRCLTCQFRVCKQCRFEQPNGLFLCRLCVRYRQEKQLTGEWAEPPLGGVHSTDLIKLSLKDKKYFKKKRKAEEKWKEEQLGWLRDQINGDFSSRLRRRKSHGKSRKRRKKSKRAGEEDGSLTRRERRLSKSYVDTGIVDECAPAGGSGPIVCFEDEIRHLDTGKKLHASSHRAYELEQAAGQSPGKDGSVSEDFIAEEKQNSEKQGEAELAKTSSILVDDVVKRDGFGSKAADLDDNTTQNTLSSSIRTSELRQLPGLHYDPPPIDVLPLQPPERRGIALSSADRLSRSYMSTLQPPPYQDHLLDHQPRFDAVCLAASQQVQLNICERKARNLEPPEVNLDSELPTKETGVGNCSARRPSLWKRMRAPVIQALRIVLRQPGRRRVRRRRKRAKTLGRYFKRKGATQRRELEGEDEARDTESEETSVKKTLSVDGMDRERTQEEASTDSVYEDANKEEKGEADNIDDCIVHNDNEDDGESYEDFESWVWPPGNDNEAGNASPPPDIDDINWNFQPKKGGGHPGLGYGPGQFHSMRGIRGGRIYRGARGRGRRGHWGPRGGVPPRVRGGARGAAAAGRSRGRGRSRSGTRLERRPSLEKRRKKMEKRLKKKKKKGKSRRKTKREESIMSGIGSLQKKLGQSMTKSRSGLHVAGDDESPKESVGDFSEGSVHVRALRKIVETESVASQTSKPPRNPVMKFLCPFCRFNIEIEDPD